MPYQGGYTNSVETKQLIRAVLKHWKTLIVIGVVCAIVFPVIKYIVDPPVKENSTEQTGEATSASEIPRPDSPEVLALKNEREVLSSNKAKLERYLSELDAQYTDLKSEKDRLEKHKKESELLNVDPYNVARAIRVYRIDKTAGSDDIDKNVLGRITTAYVNAVKENTADINETLIATPDISIIGIVVDGSWITITVTAPEKTRADDYMKKVDDAINKAKPNIISNIGDHVLALADDKSVIVTDENLKTVQEKYDDSTNTAINAVEDKIQTLSTSLYTVNTQIRTTDTSIQNASNPQTEAPAQIEEEEEEHKGTTRADIITWAILGFLTGAIAVSLWYGFKYILADTVRCEDEIKDKYGIRVIGNMADEASRQAIASVIKTLMGEDNSLVLISTQGLDACEVFVKNMKAELEDIELIVGGDLRKDAAGVNALNGKSKILLLEAVDKTPANGILYETDLVKAAGKEIIGCVVN